MEDNEYYVAPLYFKILKCSDEKLCIGAIVKDGHIYHFTRFMKFSTIGQIFKNPDEIFNELSDCLQDFRDNFYSDFHDGIEYLQPSIRISSDGLIHRYHKNIDDATKEISALYSSFHHLNY